MKKSISFLFLVLLMSVCSVSIWAQQQSTVTGMVTSATDRLPMIGVNVSVLGTSMGTVTDLDGKYQVTIPTGSTLSFTYVGTQSQEFKIKQNQTLNVVLKDGEELDELIVIGYGTVKKSNLTGAVSSVSSKDLQADVARNAANALQGRVAGVSVTNVGGQPGAGMDITIRGQSSLSSSKPLYVIDGVYGDINMIDPSDISSMEVLKDASAAAIYGSRAANGVVLITTKGGRKNMPLSVSVNVFSGIQNAVKQLDVLDAQQWVGIMKANNLSIPESAQNFEGPGTNWQNEAFRTAPITKVNIGLTGGTKTSTYNVSAGYIKQDGVLISSGYDAFNIRTKNTFSFFNDHFRIGNTLLVKNSTQDLNSVVATNLLRQNPLVPVYDDERLGGFGGVEPWMKNMDNPIGESMLDDTKRYRTEILLNAYAEVDLYKGLKYKLNVGLSKTNGRNYEYMGAYDYGQGRNDMADLDESALFDDQWLVENTIHYDETFGKSTISGLVGYSAQKNSYRTIGGGRDDLPEGTSVIGAGTSSSQSSSGSLQENTIVSLFARAMYSYDSRYMLSGSVRRDGSSRFADGHRYGVFPSASVGWNIMNESFFEEAREVMNEFKLRVSYGLLGNQEIGNYATQNTVSSGINYIQGSSPTWWLGSIVGNNWVSPTDLTWEKTATTNFGVDASFFDGKLSLTADYFVQETSDILLGISMPSSVGMGGSPTMNAGTVSNKGFELAINHRNNIGEVFYNLGLNLSSVKNNMEEIAVGSADQEFAGYDAQGEGTITWAKVGDPIGSFYLIQTDGLFRSQAEIDAHSKDGKLIQPHAEPGDVRFIDNNNDGKIDDEDKAYVGSPFPKMSYGFRAGAEWKGFDLNLFFDGVVGNKLYNYTRARMESMNEFTNFGIGALDAWTPENSGSDVPRFTQTDANANARRVSDRWLEDGSYFRLKNLEFGYTLPKALTAKAKLDRLRIYTSMENLFTATKYKGYTPDLGQNDAQNGGSSGTMTKGCDHGRYPLSRSITFGIQLNF